MSGRRGRAGPAPAGPRDLISRGEPGARSPETYVFFRMRTLMLGLAAAALSVFAATGARLARAGLVDEALVALDTNHDGVVSRDEMKAAVEAKLKAKRQRSKLSD